MATTTVPRPHRRNGDRSSDGPSRGGGTKHHLRFRPGYQRCGAAGVPSEASSEVLIEKVRSVVTDGTGCTRSSISVPALTT